MPDGPAMGLGDIGEAEGTGGSWLGTEAMAYTYGPLMPQNGHCKFCCPNKMAPEVIRASWGQAGQ